MQDAVHRKILAFAERSSDWIFWRVLNQASRGTGSESSQQRPRFWTKLPEVWALNKASRGTGSEPSQQMYGFWFNPPEVWFLNQASRSMGSQQSQQRQGFWTMPSDVRVLIQAPRSMDSEPSQQMYRLWTKAAEVRLPSLGNHSSTSQYSFLQLCHQVQSFVTQESRVIRRNLYYFVEDFIN